MNLLLSLNKTYILIVSVFVLICFIIFFLFKFYLSIENVPLKDNVKISNVDITKPKFSINSASQKIFVTANEGNFVDENEILLRKNVKFKSNNFSIESDNVIFNRKEQTAHTINKSIFKSEKTIISSDGFNIYDNGNKIKFYGNSKVILK